MLKPANAMLYFLHDMQQPPQLCGAAYQSAAVSLSGGSAYRFGTNQDHLNKQTQIEG